MFDWQQFAYDAVLALVPVFVAGLITLIGAAFSYLRVRYEWLRELRTIEQVESTLYALVQEANQTLVEEARRAREDGKLTPEDAERIKTAVIERFWRIVTVEQSRILQAIADDVEAWLSAKIEEMVVKAKASAPFDSSRGA
jgi:hypothetical protein